MVQLQTNYNVTDSRLRDLLCSALEGGSNYWYENARPELAEGVNREDFREGGKHTVEEYWHPFQLIPFHNGCSVVVDVDENEDGKPEQHKINREALENGIKLMAEKFPQHFDNVKNENDDAETGDVFLQLALFGELVFG